MLLLRRPAACATALRCGAEPADGPRPWSDWIKVLAPRPAVIAIDQRNAGHSNGAMRSKSPNWTTYAHDRSSQASRHFVVPSLRRLHRLELYLRSSSNSNQASATRPCRCDHLDPQFPAYFSEASPSSTRSRSRRSRARPRSATHSGRRMWSSDFVFSVTRIHPPLVGTTRNDKPHSGRGGR